MNSHRHARLAYARRIEMVKQTTTGGLSAPEAAAAHGYSANRQEVAQTRYLTGGADGLLLSLAAVGAGVALLFAVAMRGPAAGPAAATSARSAH